jgi:hypothetical protein
MDSILLDKLKIAVHPPITLALLLFWFWLRYGCQKSEPISVRTNQEIGTKMVRKRERAMDFQWIILGILLAINNLVILLPNTIKFN